MNLDDLSQRVQQGRVDASSVITMQTLREGGLLGKKVSTGVKLLGRVRTIWHYHSTCNEQQEACFVTVH